jgi:hypothetical protein
MIKDEGSILLGMTAGQAKEILYNKPNNPMSELLQSLTQDVIDDLRKAMDNRDVNASSRLSQGITPTKTNYNGKSVSVSIEMDFYWKYINYGVNGSVVNRGAPNWGSAPSSGLSMSQALSSWERDRGIRYENGESTWTSKSHIEGLGLIERGQIARPFYEDVINEKLVNVLKAPIQKLLGKSIKLNIISPWQ